MTHERIVPTVLPYQSSGYVLSKPLPFRDRLRLLFGARILANSMMLTQHKPGQKIIATRFFVTGSDTLEHAVNAHEQRQVAEHKAKETAALDAKENAK